MQSGEGQRKPSVIAYKPLVVEATNGKTAEERGRINEYNCKKIGHITKQCSHREATAERET